MQEITQGANEHENSDDHPADDEEIDQFEEIQPPSHDAMIEAFKTMSNYLNTNDVPINYYEFLEKNGI